MDASGAFAIPEPRERYELGKVLGEGGMGQVVEAFDRRLDRKVALKFLTYPDPAVLEMFQREARSQARVQHDHVLEVYDIGELDGRPFISMRHLPGKNLEQRREQLSLESLVRLLAQTAEGLHAAHREGLLHHDVKPSNVLVDENPDGDLVAYISDFGVASRVEDSSGIAGTPSYLAPERVSHGSIDRRSDIYSLGITMYEMFTGKVPFKDRNPLALFHKIANEPATPPRTHRPSLPVELEAIVMRCLAKNPDDRYRSARAVAEDLRRYLDGEVVEAYTAGLAYRLTRFALRNKILVAMAVIALVALLISSVAVAIFAVQAESARRHAESARKDSEQRREQAENLIGFMVGNLQGKLKELGRLDVLDEVGDEALQYFASVPETALTDQELLWRSQMLYQIGEVRVRQGKFAEAAAPMEESLALARRLSDLRPDDPDRLFALGQSHFWVGFVHWKQLAFDKALGPMEDYLEVSRRLLATDPSRLDWQMEVAYAHNNLSAVLRSQGELKPALSHLQQAAQIVHNGIEKEPERLDWHFRLAENKGKTGRVFRKLGRLPEAQEAFEQELAIRLSLMAPDSQDAPKQRNLAVCHTALGHLHLHRGRLADAQEHLEASQAIYSTLSQTDPDNDDLKFQHAWIDIFLGKLSWTQGDEATARNRWKVAIQSATQALTRDPTAGHWREARSTATLLLALGKRAKNPAEARHLTEQAIRELSHTEPGQSKSLPLHWLAKAHLQLGDLARNDEEARQAAETAPRLCCRVCSQLETRRATRGLGGSSASPRAYRGSRYSPRHSPGAGIRRSRIYRAVPAGAHRLPACLA